MLVVHVALGSLFFFCSLRCPRHYPAASPVRMHLGRSYVPQGGSTKNVHNIATDDHGLTMHSYISRTNGSSTVVQREYSAA